MPTDSKLPPYMYGTTGGHGYYDLKLKEIRCYPELQSQVLRNFKEVGNLIIFLNMCESALVSFWEISWKIERKLAENSVVSAQHADF